MDLRRLLAEEPDEAPLCPRCSYRPAVDGEWCAECVAEHAEEAAAALDRSSARRFAAAQRRARRVAYLHERLDYLDRIDAKH